MMPRLVLLSAILLGGCTLGPDYVRPELPKADVFPEAGKGGVTVRAEWWKSLGDDEQVDEEVWYVRKGGDGGKIRRVTRSSLVGAANAGKLKTHYELSRSPGGPFRPISATEFKAS